jgi:hypothetical protein
VASSLSPPVTPTQNSKFEIQNSTWITLGALKVSFAGEGYCEDQSQQVCGMR